MSDGNNICRSYLAAEEPRYKKTAGVLADPELQSTVTREECGVDLLGIPDNDQTRDLFKAASKTGSRLIFSFADAFETLKADRVAGGCLDGISGRENLGGCREKQTLEMRAQAFLESARTLVEKLREQIRQQTNSLDMGIKFLGGGGGGRWY